MRRKLRVCNVHVTGSRESMLLTMAMADILIIIVPILELAAHVNADRIAEDLAKTAVTNPQQRQRSYTARN